MMGLIQEMDCYRDSRGAIIMNGYIRGDVAQEYLSEQYRLNDAVTEVCIRYNEKTMKMSWIAFDVFGNIVSTGNISAKKEDYGDFREQLHHFVDKGLHTWK